VSGTKLNSQTPSYNFCIHQAMESNFDTGGIAMAAKP
jgi:hypothetical protein